MVLQSFHVDSEFLPQIDLHFLCVHPVAFLLHLELEGPVLGVPPERCQGC